jgi:hypothetical protein
MYAPFRALLARRNLPWVGAGGAGEAVDVLVVVAEDMSWTVDVRVRVSRSTAVDVTVETTTWVEVDTTGMLTVSVTVEMVVSAGWV